MPDITTDQADISYDTWILASAWNPKDGPPQVFPRYTGRITRYTAENTCFLKSFDTEVNQDIYVHFSVINKYTVF